MTISCAAEMTLVDQIELIRVPRLQMVSEHDLIAALHSNDPMESAAAIRVISQMQALCAKYSSDLRDNYTRWNKSIWPRFKARTNITDEELASYHHFIYKSTLRALRKAGDAESIRFAIDMINQDFELRGNDISILYPKQRSDNPTIVHHIELKKSFQKWLMSEDPDVVFWASIRLAQFNDVSDIPLLEERLGYWDKRNDKKALRGINRALHELKGLAKNQGKGSQPDNTSSGENPDQSSTPFSSPNTGSVDMFAPPDKGSQDDPKNED